MERQIKDEEIVVREVMALPAGLQLPDFDTARSAGEILGIAAEGDAPKATLQTNSP
jgi:hypothetical protein